MSSPLIVHTTDATFESDVLKSAEPVLLDFWAEWCGPCKAIAPILDEVAGEYKGRLKVVKVNVDDCQQTSMKYGVRSIPTLFVISKGAVQAQRPGSLSKSQLVAFLESNLASGSAAGSAG